MERCSASCPYCQQVISTPAHLAGTIVVCPNCRQQIQLPEIVPLRIVETPLPMIRTSAPNFQSGASRYSRANRKTDPFAIACFASGLLSLLILPVLMIPVCFISSMISYYQLKENKNLTGGGLRIAGHIMGSIALIFYMWLIGAFGGPAALEPVRQAILGL